MHDYQHSGTTPEQRDAFFSACDRAATSHVERVSTAYGRLYDMRGAVSDVLTDTTPDEWATICHDWKVITHGKPERQTREWFVDFWCLEPMPVGQWRRLKRDLFA